MLSVQVMVLKTSSHNQGAGRMTLIILGLSVGTVQLMLLNLLQAVVIMADISFLRVTVSRESTFARPPWFILCQAVHCQDDHTAYPRWALESHQPDWEQFGHPLVYLRKDKRCRLETLSGRVPEGRRNVHSQMIRRKPWKRRRIVATACSWVKANWILLLLQEMPVP